MFKPELFVAGFIVVSLLSLLYDDPDVLKNVRTVFADKRIPYNLALAEGEKNRLVVAKEIVDRLLGRFAQRTTRDGQYLSVTVSYRVKQTAVSATTIAMIKEIMVNDPVGKTYPLIDRLAWENDSVANNLYFTAVTVYFSRGMN